MDAEVREWIEKLVLAVASPFQQNDTNGLPQPIEVKPRIAQDSCHLEVVYRYEHPEILYGFRVRVVSDGAILGWDGNWRGSDSPFLLAEDILLALEETQAPYQVKPCLVRFHESLGTFVIWWGDVDTRGAEAIEEIALDEIQSRLVQAVSRDLKRLGADLSVLSVRVSQSHDGLLHAHVKVSSASEYFSLTTVPFSPHQSETTTSDIVAGLQAGITPDLLELFE